MKSNFEIQTEKAIKQMRENENPSTINPTAVANRYQSLLHEIYALQRKIKERSDVDNQDPWIPCAERLPTEEESKNEDGWHVNFAVWRSDREYWVRASYSASSGHWINTNETPVLFKNATYWMFITAPIIPQGDNES